MVTLNYIHFTYMAIMIFIIAIMAMKKDVIIPCIVGLFLIGLVNTGSVLQGIQVMFKSLLVAGNSFWDIILIISLVVAMSKALQSFGVDKYMLRPISKLMVSRNIAFFVLGIIMLIVSFVIWPSPAVALVGAIILPAALAAGLSPLWAAVAMNLFGHGAGLSGDFFIQGAPRITAETSGVSTQEILSKSFILWSVMVVVMISTAFFMMTRDYKKGKIAGGSSLVNSAVDIDIKPTFKMKLVGFITILTLLVDLICMIKFEIRGGDATALVGGSVMIIMLICTIAEHGLSEAFEKTTDNISAGFLFGMKIFAPIIVIGAFFFLGGEETAKAIFGESASGIFNDIGIALSQTVPLSKFPVVVVQALIAFLAGLDGSGFSGLPLVGSLAMTFSQTVNIDRAGLAALGQIITIVVGGGTIIPWAVIPVAAICNVNPVDLARKNMIPVLSGIVAMIITATIIF